MATPGSRSSPSARRLRFHNLDPAESRGAAVLLRWALTRERARWPRRVEDPAYPPPGPVAPGHVGVTFIGHCTFLLRFPGLTLLTDPQFSERASPVQWAGPRRARAPGIGLHTLPRVDAVLLSHDHYDHMDLPSLRALHARWAPRVVTTLGNAQRLARAGMPGAVELDWWQDCTVGPARITATPARHFSGRTPFDRFQTLWAGFMVDTEDGRLFFAGDSGMGRHWAMIRDRLGPPGVALLPIGAYEPREIMAVVHVNPEEAVVARAELGAARAIGMHWGTFQLTDEGIEEPVRALEAARAAAGLSPECFDVMGFGETRALPLR